MASVIARIETIGSVIGNSPRRDLDVKVVRIVDVKNGENEEEIIADRKFYGAFVEDVIHFARTSTARRVYLDGKLVHGATPIERAKDEIASREQARLDALALIADFQKHLLTPKFHEERWISIDDVQRRLAEIREALLI
jgi:hypothetical protein